MIKNFFLAFAMCLSLGFTIFPTNQGTMNKIIAIRREDKNKWEKRTPLVPSDVKELKEKYKIHTIVQPSSIRIFTDQEYIDAGAEINEDLNCASLILAVKEIPEKLFEYKKTYMFYSHTIKGQSYNMPMLKHMMSLKTNLIDYERIIYENNKNLISSSRHAGLAGMIESFYALGQKLKLNDFDTPFSKIKQAYEYESLEEARKEINLIGEQIKNQGLPKEICPLVIGFSGYGNVSKGAQEIFDLLPHKKITPSELIKNYENFSHDNKYLYKIIFKEEDLVKPIIGKFDLQKYYKFPEKYESQFERYISFLTMLVNCIYWTDSYPKLITKSYLQNNSNINLKIIGDISCDIDGAIEITNKSTQPDNPCFTYLSDKDEYIDGIQENGITIMAVDNLPCEFAKEASIEFSYALKKFANEIVSANYNDTFENLDLPNPIKKALILHNGSLTNEYRYMENYLN